MKHYGKLEGRKVTYEVGDAKYDCLVFFDKDGISWHDVNKFHPSEAYMAVDDDGTIFSLQEDFEQIQIGGYDLYGLTSKEVEMRGKHTHFKNKTFFTPVPKKSEVEERLDRLEKLLEKLLEK